MVVCGGVKKQVLVFEMLTDLLEHKVYALRLHLSRSGLCADLRSLVGG